MVVCPDEMDTSYLENLDEAVNDEGKIVTYKWLSLTLRVHSNVAKQMLYHFATQQRSDAGGGRDLTLTYLLSGLVEESGDGGDGGRRLRKVVKVVCEGELEAARTSMTVVKSVHVYSVQRSTLPDVGVLYGADYDLVKQHLSNVVRYSGIKCSEAQVTPSTGRLRQVVQGEAPPPPLLHKNVAKSDQKKENKINAEVKSTTSAANTTTTTTTTTTTSKPSNPIASMFAQQTKRQEGTQKTAVKEEKGTGKTRPAGISAFFTKGTGTRKTDTSSSSSSSSVKSDPTPCPAKPKESEATEDPEGGTKGVEDVQGLVKVKEEKEDCDGGGGGGAKVKIGKKKTSSSSQKKRKSKGKKEEPKTKRTRIMQMSDSESDEEEEEEEGEEEEDAKMLLHPSPPRVKVESDSEEEKEEGEKKSLHSSTAPQEEDVKPGMRRKMVDEVYENENGYLVTSKVWKLVPLTEEEIKEEEKERKEEEEKRSKKEEERRKKEEEEKRRKEKSSPTTSSSSPQKKKRGGKKDDNKKQSKIMNFFTKK